MVRRAWGAAAVALAVVLGALALGIGGAGRWARPAGGVGAGVRVAVAAVQGPAPGLARGRAGEVKAAAVGVQREREDGREAGTDRRTARAEQTLAGYLASTRYPPSCRPIGERPDLAEPHRVPVRWLPLARAGGVEGAGPAEAGARARVRLQQDRYRAAAGEAVELGLACEVDGAPAACEVRSARAEVAPDMPPVGAPVEVRFTDAGEGAVSARFAPAEQGFAAYHGPIRITVALRVGAEEGSASFDVEYTPTAPATFSGSFREELAEGSLALHVGMRVERAGRYVVRARVEDAEGRRFAYLTESATLGSGDGEVRLQLFGKVVADAGARAPFRLRDVEGFRLLEDAYPDREAMTGLDGVVYTTRRHDAADFSAAEWDSDVKTRQVALLTRSLEAARGRTEGAR